MSNQRAYRTYNYAFGNQVLLLRTRAALTQQALAEAIGVHRRSVQNWETGTAYPKAAALQRLIAVLLRLDAFTMGSERDEAQTLWEQAAHDTQAPLVPFDDVWFARLLVARVAEPGAWPRPDGDDGNLLSNARVDTGSPFGEPAGSASLPSRTTPFIGRGPELAELARLLTDAACRLLTLVGPGGIGKTRLAIEFAASKADAFADGAVFVALASVESPSQIASAISDALHLSIAGHADPTVHLLAALRDRHLLLVLDNFEHLLDGAELIGTILEQAPAVVILTTSRERLNLQAEWLFDVDGLAYPAEHQRSMSPNTLAALADYSAIELFVQRAQQVRPALALSGSTLTTITRICQRVAGMPLAIELAAAGVRMLSVPEIERQIGTRLDVLSTTLRDVPPRHRSLRAVFDHSWALLSEAERIVLSRLAVFRADCTAQAAEEVAAAPLPRLLALVEKSLLRQERDERWLSDGDNTAGQYFVMLEPIREYAQEQLDASPDAAHVHEQHALYFTRLAEAALADWDTPRINQAIARQRREHDNLRAALRWACDTGNSALGLRLTAALWGFWRSYGYSREGRAWIERVLQLDPRSSDRTAMDARRRGLHAAAWLASDQHEYAIAAQLFQESMELREALGETDGELDLLINAAREARAVGDYYRATTLLEDALLRVRRGPDAWGRTSGTQPAPPELGQVLRELALVCRERGDFAAATHMLNEALDLHRTVGDRVSTALAQLGLGDVARDVGDGAGVRAACAPSLAVFRESGMHWAIGFALNNLACGALYERDLPRAVSLVRESEALFRELNSDASLAEVLLTHGSILRAQGNPTAAHAALREALRLARTAGPRLLVAASLEGLASVAADQGHADRSVRLLAAATALREEMGAPVRPADQRAVDAALASAEASLGHEAMAAAWATASRQPLEQFFEMLSSS